MSNSLVTFTTVNSGSRMTVPLSSVSHVIEHQDTKSLDDTESTCWIHFHSGKSVHVKETYETCHQDLDEYYSTHHERI